MATLSVRSSVSRAKVYVDGMEMGQTPLVNFALSAGDHRIRVEKEGYKSYEKSINIEEDRSSSLYASLTPIRAVQQTGRLYVDTEPGNARVRILNITPRYHRGIEVKAGRYNVEVSKSGYETRKQWIELAAGEDKYIDIRLAKRHAVVTPPSADKTFTNSIGMKFVLIPKGTFMMGSPSNEPKRDSDEGQHRVTISRPYYLQTTEVTQKQWRKIMGNNPSYFKGDNRPVENVSWDDCREFIRKLNRKEGTDKYRLPTEDEWEYACRAGTTTPFYTGGCISTDQANYNGNYLMRGCSKGRYRKETVSVASFSPNAWGLFDMHGNVCEWCKDWDKEDYPSGHVTDPRGPSSEPLRVVHGGSWRGNAGEVRSASRFWHPLGYGDSYTGFRVARTR